MGLRGLDNLQSPWQKIIGAGPLSPDLETVGQLRLPAPNSGPRYGPPRSAHGRNSHQILTAKPAHHSCRFLAQFSPAQLSASPAPEDAEPKEGVGGQCVEGRWLVGVKQMNCQPGESSPGLGQKIKEWHYYIKQMCRVNLKSKESC